MRLLILIYAILCVTLLVLAVAAHEHPYFAWDLRWELALQAVAVPGFAPVMRAFTWVGNDWPYAITVALIAFGFLLWGNRRDAVAMVGSVIGAAVFAFIIKQLVHRPRPSLAAISIMRSRHTFGFPSGHVVRFVAFYGFLFALTLLKLRDSVTRTLILVLLAGLLIGIGLSRIYVGEHWPSDVLGGYLTGLCWLGPALVIYTRSRIRQGPVLTGYPPLP